MSLIDNKIYSSVQSTQTTQNEAVRASATSRATVGIGDILSTISSNTPVPLLITQFASAVKDQISAWVRTVRVYILSKQLDDDASRLSMATKDADLNLLEGLIELFQKRWNNLAPQTKKDFFIGLFNNENYLQAYQLAYKKGIPFIDESFSSKGDQKAHIFSYLVHEQPSVLSLIYIEDVINPKTAQLLQHFSTINDQVEELKQIPHCCTDCSLRYEQVSDASTATDQEDVALSDPHLIAKALSSSDAKEADQIIKNLLEGEYRFKSDEEKRMIFTTALERGWSESAQIMSSRYPELTRLVEKCGPQLMQKAFSSSDAKEADQIVKTLVTVGYTRFFPAPELKKEIVLKAFENKWKGTLQIMNEHHPEVVQKFGRQFQ